MFFLATPFSVCTEGPLRQVHIRPKRGSQAQMQQLLHALRTRKHSDPKSNFQSLNRQMTGVTAILPSGHKPRQAESKRSNPTGKSLTRQPVQGISSLQMHKVSSWQPRKESVSTTLGCETLTPSPHGQPMGDLHHIGLGMVSVHHQRGCGRTIVHGRVSMTTSSSSRRSHVLHHMGMAMVSVHHQRGCAAPLSTARSP